MTLRDDLKAVMSAIKKAREATQIWKDHIHTKGWNGESPLHDDKNHAWARANDCAVAFIDNNAENLLAEQAEQRVKALEAELAALRNPMPVLTRYEPGRYEFDEELFDLCRADDYAAIYLVIQKRIDAALAAQGSDGQREGEAMNEPQRLQLLNILEEYVCTIESDDVTTDGRYSVADIRAQMRLLEKSND